MRRRQTLGGIIAAAREARGLSLRQVGQALTRPVHATYVNKIELGEKQPRDPDFLADLARVLEIPVDVLYYVTNQLPPDVAGRRLSPAQIAKGYEAMRRAVAA